MDDIDLNEIVDAWIAAENATSGSAEREAHDWAIEHVILSSLSPEGGLSMELRRRCLHTRAVGQGHCRFGRWAA